MTLDQVGDVLKVLAAYDGRNVGTADLMVWGRQLADIEFADAVEAVHEHYGADGEWAKPHHIRSRAEKIHNARNKRPDVPAPGCYEPDPIERRRLVDAAGTPALPGPDLPEVKTGQAHCSDVLAAIGARLAARRATDSGESSESEARRQRALAVARASRRGARS